MQYPGMPPPGAPAWPGAYPDPWASAAYGVPPGYPPQAAPPPGYGPTSYGTPPPGMYGMPPPAHAGYPPVHGHPPGMPAAAVQLALPPPEHHHHHHDRDRDRDRDRGNDRGGGGGGGKAGRNDKQGKKADRKGDKQDKRGGGGGGGEPRMLLTVSGCKHDVVGDIVNGSFSQTSTRNHERPVYKKTAKTSSGLDVHVYYWDDRDGANFCGWYFGQRVGGDEVWAYHPSQGATPPTSDWKVPYDGDVDKDITLKLREEKKQNAQGSGNPGGNNKRGHEGGNSEPPGKQSRQENREADPPSPYPVAAMPGMPPPMVPPMHLSPWELQQWHMMQAQHAYHSQMHAAQQQKQDNKRKAEDDRRRRQDDERRRKEEEQRKKQAEEKATKIILQVCQKLRVATPETFDELKKDLDDTLAKEMPNAYGSSQRMQEEADKALAQATKCVEMINARRKLVEDKKRELEEKQRAVEERAKELLEELLSLVAAAEEQSKRLEEAAKPFGGLPIKAKVATVPPPPPAPVAAPTSSPAPAAVPEAEAEAEAEAEKKVVEEPEKPEPIDPATLTDEELLDAVQAIELVGVEAESMTKACTQFVLRKGAELKSLVPMAKLTDPIDMNKALAKLLGQIQELAVSSETMLNKAKQAKLMVAKRTSAKQRLQKGEATFKRYDKDRDGFLSRGEISAYAKGECSITLPARIMDRIFATLVAEGTKGVSFQDFQQLKVTVGVARECARDDQRKIVTAQKMKVITQIRQGLSEKLRQLHNVAEEVNNSVLQMEKQMQPMLSKARSLTPLEMMEKSANGDMSIEDTVGAVETLRTKLSELSEGVEKRFQEDVRMFVKTQAKPLYLSLGRMEARVGRARNLSRRFREAAKRRKKNELEKLRKNAGRVIRHNLKLKGIEQKSLFGPVVSEEDLWSFFESADAEISLVAEAAAAAAAAPAADGSADDTAAAVAGSAADDGAVDAAAAEGGEKAEEESSKSNGNGEEGGAAATEATAGDPAETPAAGSSLNGTPMETEALPEPMDPASIDGELDAAPPTTSDAATPAAPVAAPSSPSALAAATPKAAGPTIVAPPVGGIKAMIGKGDAELTDEVKQWLEAELAALKNGGKAPVPEKASETVKLSREDISRLFSAIIGRGDEVLDISEPIMDGIVDGDKISREHLFACLGMALP